MEQVFERREAGAFLKSLLAIQAWGALYPGHDCTARRSLHWRSAPELGVGPAWTLIRCGSLQTAVSH